jgi:hypothetical protein
VNHRCAATVLLFMRRTAHRLASLTIASSVLGVFGVPAFAQVDSQPRILIALERTSSTAVREYQPAQQAVSSHVVLPPNVLTSPSYRAFLESMLRKSPMFRRQCERIAAAPSLTVRIHRSTSHWRGRSRARTNIVRQPFGALIATIEIPPMDDDVELVAHEIEHVIEQLDGVDLVSNAARAGSGVDTFHEGEKVFETLRARRIGLIVAREVGTVRR